MGSVYINLGILTMILVILPNDCIACTDCKTDSPEEVKKGEVVKFVPADYYLKSVLPSLEKPLKYTFILVKHGMVVPEFTRSRTYPNDEKFKPYWEPGKATSKGRSLMLMVGKTLNTRYKEFLKSTSWDHIKVSSITKEYAKRLSSDLGIGLFTGTTHDKQLGPDLSWVHTDSNFEKTDQLVPVHRAKCNWMKILHERFETEVDNGGKHLTKCTENLYESLRRNITVTDDKDWIMDAPKKVYNLWNLLVFEVQHGQKEPKWAKQEWSRIQSCVFEYHRELLRYHLAIPALLTGRVIKQMEEELGSDNNKLHAHVTHDIGILSLSWTALHNDCIHDVSVLGKDWAQQSADWEFPNCPIDYWPDPGDALIFDFFTDETVQVSSVSGLEATYQQIYEGSQEEFFQKFKNKKIYLSDAEWDMLCAHDGNSKPPEEMDGSLF